MYVCVYIYIYIYTYIYIYIYIYGRRRLRHRQSLKGKPTILLLLLLLLLLVLLILPFPLLFLFLRGSFDYPFGLPTCSFRPSKTSLGMSNSPYFLKKDLSLTHSLTGAVPPVGGICGAAHNRSCVPLPARPERLYVLRRLEPVTH